MATEVQVEASKGSDDIIHCEVSGSISGEFGPGTHNFKVGVIGSGVCYLTVLRLVSCDVKIIAVSGDIIVELDNKPKKVKRGKSLQIPPKTKRTVVKEKI